MQKPLIPALILALLFVFGCGKSTDTPENPILWVVSVYDDKQIGDNLTDDTDLFEGYTFEFNTDNTLKINLPDGNIHPAKWGAAPGGTTFMIGMENPFDPVVYLVGAWEINEYSATDIKLKRDIGAEPNVAHAPLLEFKKQ